MNCIEVSGLQFLWALGWFYVLVAVPHYYLGKLIARDEQLRKATEPSKEGA